MLKIVNFKLSNAISSVLFEYIGDCQLEEPHEVGE